MPFQHWGHVLHWPLPPPSWVLPLRCDQGHMPLPRSVKSFPLNRVCLSQEKNQRKTAWQRRYHQDSSLVISSGLFVSVEFMKFK